MLCPLLSSLSAWGPWGPWGVPPGGGGQCSPMRAGGQEPRLLGAACPMGLPAAMFELPCGAERNAVPHWGGMHVVGMQCWPGGLPGRGSAMLGGHALPGSHAGYVKSIWTFSCWGVAPSAGLMSTWPTAERLCHMHHICPESALNTIHTNGTATICRA